MNTGNDKCKYVGTMFDSAFKLGDKVRKKSGSEWSGKIVGFYSTDLTPSGVCVESDTHSGSVQIYPEKAMEIQE